MRLFSFLLYAFLLLGSATAPVWASEFRSQAECRAWAEIARGIATDRDAGVSIETIIQTVAKAAATDHNGQQLMFRDDADEFYAGQLVGLIYVHPDGSPDQVAHWMYGMCEKARTELQPSAKHGA